MRIELMQSEDGTWSWRIMAGNGRVVATAGQWFGRKQHCKDAVTNLVKEIYSLQGTIPVKSVPFVVAEVKI